MTGKWKAGNVRKGFAIGVVCCLLLILATRRYVGDGQQDRASRDREDSSNNRSEIWPVAPSMRNRLSFTATARFFGRKLRWQGREQPIPVADYAMKGLAGPFFTILEHEQIELLPKILRDWEGMKARLSESLINRGFKAPSDRTCFLWLEDCFKLGRHRSVVEVVEGILGHPVLLFGFSVWNAPPRSKQALRIRFEGFQCETMDVLVNSGARLIQNSHTMSQRTAMRLANQIKAVTRFYGDDSHQSQQRIESVALMQLADKLEGVTVQEIDFERGGVYAINGRLLYGTSNPTETMQTSLLLQFVPANCTLREQELDSSQLAFVSKPVLPPTLLASVTSNGTNGLRSNSLNDVREGLAQDEVLDFEEPVETSECRLLGTLPGSNITILRRKSSAGAVHSFARSHLLDRITVEKFSFQELNVAFKSSPEDQVVVVVRGTLNHHHAGHGYREVRELKSGDLAYLASTELHALTAAASAEYIRIGWAGKEGAPLSIGVRKSISNGKQLFEMPVNNLGAINAKTIGLKTGQAYDPENEADCDVLVVVLKGAHLLIVPTQESLQENEAVLIPAGEACILWNSGLFPVTVVALQLYKSIVVDNRESNYLEAAYRTRGKIM